MRRNVGDHHIARNDTGRLSDGYCKRTTIIIIVRRGRGAALEQACTDYDIRAVGDWCGRASAVLVAGCEGVNA